MSAVAVDERPTLGVPIVLSVLLHVAAGAALLFVQPATHAPGAPIYRVSLIAAPAGERAIGVVQPTPAPVTPAPTPATPKPVPRARETPAPERTTLPAKTAVARPAKTATPNAAKAAPTTKAPVAGGGPEGGRGADVANVKADGIAFPYPVYLANIVRQIALNFKPTARGALTAEVSFMIRRDGTVAGARLTRRSSVYSFDQDALAAIELASRAFGPLPDGFPDDVLPVVFSFDPRLIH